MKRLVCLSCVKRLANCALAFFFLFFHSAFATNREKSPCVAAFEHLQFKNIETISPDLHLFLSSKAIGRILSSQPSAYKTIEDIIAGPLKEADAFSFEINNSDLKVHLSIARSNNHITVIIHDLALTENVDSKTKSYVTFGKRNNTLNMGFPRLLFAIASGLNRQIASDPNITHVVLQGRTIMNEHLVGQLKRFGFVSTSNWTAPMKTTKGGFLAFSNFFIQFMGGLLKSTKSVGSKRDLLENPYKKVIKPVVGVNSAAKKIKVANASNPLGKTWEIVLELEKDIGELPPAN